MLPKISVCLLTYKRAVLVGKTIESLLAQSFTDFELVINDDCSPDDTEQVCREYAARDPRVRYFRNARNLRYSGNQNAALERARCEYIAFVHDGDIYYPDMLQRWHDVLQRHPSVGLVFNSQASLDTTGQVDRIYQHPYAEMIPGRLMAEHVLTEGYFPIWGILICRKAVFARVGLFDGRFPVLADVDMWFRIMLHYDIGYVREPLFALWPREAGHQNRGINWKIEQECELIYWLNLRRFDEATGVAHDYLWKGQDVIMRRRQLFALAWCLLKGKAGRLLTGIRHMSSFKARRAAARTGATGTVPALSA